MRLAVASLVIAASLLTSAEAAPRGNAGGAWTFAKHVDKMNDDTECVLNAPTKHILFKFSNDKAYVVAQHVIGVGDESNLLEARVDENPMMTLSVRTVDGRLGAIEDRAELGQLSSQLAKGHVLRLRMLTAGGLEEDATSYRNFSSAYDGFSACFYSHW